MIASVARLVMKPLTARPTAEELPHRIQFPARADGLFLCQAEEAILSGDRDIPAWL
jgi:hypothetical protein